MRSNLPTQRRSSTLQVTHPLALVGLGSQLCAGPSAKPCCTADPPTFVCSSNEGDDLLSRQPPPLSLVPSTREKNQHPLPSLVVSRSLSNCQRSRTARPPTHHPNTKCGMLVGSVRGLTSSSERSCSALFHVHGVQEAADHTPCVPQQLHRTVSNDSSLAVLLLPTPSTPTPVPSVAVSLCELAPHLLLAVCTFTTQLRRSTIAAQTFSLDFTRTCSILTLTSLRTTSTCQPPFASCHVLCAWRRVCPCLPPTTIGRWWARPAICGLHGLYLHAQTSI